jgi:hypothetical protein
VRVPCCPYLVVPEFVILPSTVRVEARCIISASQPGYIDRFACSVTQCLLPPLESEYKQSAAQRLPRLTSIVSPQCLVPVPSNGRDLHERALGYPHHFAAWPPHLVVERELAESSIRDCACRQTHRLTDWNVTSRGMIDEGQHTDGPQAQRLRDATRHKRQGLEILIHRLAVTKAFPESIDLMHEPLLIGGILGELVRQPCERVPGRVVACPERLVIEARWGSKPLAFAGKLQPRRLIK